jgi:hypothetical protein
MLVPAGSEHTLPTGRKLKSGSCMKFDWNISNTYKIQAKTYNPLTKDADSKRCCPQNREADKDNHPYIFFFHDMRLLIV